MVVISCPYTNCIIVLDGPVLCTDFLSTILLSNVYYVADILGKTTLQAYTRADGHVPRDASAATNS